MEHVLLSRELEQEKIFTQAYILYGEKVLLRSFHAFQFFLQVKDCASVIIDERTSNLSASFSASELQELYGQILDNNPKCLVVFLYEEGLSQLLHLKKKSHYTIFLKRESFTQQKLNYIFSIHRHQEYRSLFIKDLQPTLKVPIDLHLFHPINQSYPCFIPKGTEIKPEILDRLDKDNVSQLFIKKGDFKHFLDISQKVYHLYFSEEMHYIRKRYKYFLSDIVDDAEKGEWGKGRYLLDEMTAIYQALSELIAKFEAPEQALKKLTFLRQTPITQGLNCGVYAIVFARILGLDNEKELCFSALIYGLGKSEVPSQHQIRTSLDNIDLTLRSSYLRYVEYSIELIKKRKISVSTQVLENIKSHKEYFDGSGYPHGLIGDRIPKNAQLLGIIEAFNNLYTFRQNEKFLNFKRAWVTLRENSKNAVMGAKHSPKLLDEIQRRLIKRGVLQDMPQK